MGMALKPSKCRSFSLVRGKQTVVDSKIGDNVVPSILNEEEIFFGKLQFFQGKPQNTFDHIKEVFKEKLDNIENLMIRNEQKVWSYKNYFLPGVRFLLTVHDLTQTHVQQLDAFTHVFLKRWAGLPSSATNLVIHMKVGLNISTIETLYHTFHSLTHTAMRLKGDITVNSAIDNALQRETEWTRKKSTVVYSESVHTFAVAMTCVNEEVPALSDDSTTKKTLNLHKR